MLAPPSALFDVHRLVPPALARVIASQRQHKTAVIAGANEQGRRLAERISTNQLLGIRFAGYFEDRSNGRLDGINRSEVLGPLRQLANFVKSQRIDVIYLALPMSSQPRIRKLLDDLHDTTASLYFVPDVLMFDLIQARVDTIGGIPVVAVCESPFHGFNQLIKRASDIAFAAAILLLTAPFMLAFALGVKLSSPGPVIFKQRRYGLDGEEIVVYKFRSMTVTEDGAEMRQCAQSDSRLTRLGAFMRRTSLDELPQFINVLQGRMSIVGPRPHAVAHNELYRKLIKGYMQRHKVRPGVTGWAQVNGLRGETVTLERMRARIDHDLDYLRNWSLRLDLYIVAKTAWVVLKGDNAH